MRTIYETRAKTINGILSGMNADFSVLYEQIPKNNVTRDAYVLRPRDTGEMSPTVYLNGEMLDKTDGELAAWLMDLYMHNRHKTPDMTAILSRERILETVLPRLFSAENAERLDSRDRVYDRMLDLLICYYLPVDELCGDDAVASIPVTKGMLIAADISAEELKEAALENMRGTVDIVSMSEMLQSLTGLPMFESDNVPLWIVTNKKRVHGAAAILLDDVKEELQSRLGSCYYILPSSTHELIACPANADTDSLSLVQMVTEINRDQVALEERLVDGAYIVRDGVMSMLA